MKVHVRALSVVVALADLSGCIPAYKISVPSASEPPNFVLVDKRSDAGKEGNRSRLITSCDYGITHLGESELEPRRFEVLKSKLQAEEGLREKLKGKTIVIDSFEIIRNLQMSLRKNVGERHAGALPPALIYNCIAGPEIDGSYLPSENPQHLPSFTIILKAKIAGQSYNVRHFETANSVNETLSRTEGNILPRVLNNALGKFAQEIAARN